MGSYFEYCLEKSLDKLDFIMSSGEDIELYTGYSMEEINASLDEFGFSLVVDECYLVIKVARGEEIEISSARDLLANTENIIKLLPLFNSMNEEELREYVLYTLDEPSLRIMISYLCYLRSQDYKMQQIQKELSLAKKKIITLENAENTRKDKVTSTSHNHSTTNDYESNKTDDYDPDFCDYNSPGYHDYWLNN